MKSNALSPRTPLLIRRVRPAVRAFSLVETALALGIVAFAFVGLMGMLPAGLTMFRASIDATVSAQIVQRIVGDVEQTDFDTLIATATNKDTYYYVLPLRYFDDQGSEVRPVNPATPSVDEQRRILYRVRVRGSQPGPSDTAAGSDYFTSLPDVNGTRFHPRDSTILTIQIANNPAGKTLADDGAKQWVWDLAAAAKIGVSLSIQSAVITRSHRQ